MKAPVLFDLGGTKVKDASPAVFAGTEKLVRDGVPSLTMKLAVVVPPV